MVKKVVEDTNILFMVLAFSSKIKQDRTYLVENKSIAYSLQLTAYSLQPTAKSLQPKALIKKSLKSFDNSMEYFGGKYPIESYCVDCPQMNSSEGLVSGGWFILKSK